LQKANYSGVNISSFVAEKKGERLYMKLLMIVFGLSLLVGNIYPQTGAKTVKFSSLYSNLDKDCKAIGGKDEDQASDCRGIGGYRIFISPTAALLFISANAPDKKTSISLVSQDFDFDQQKRKVEWRIANGKPFAVIMRVNKYDDVADNIHYLGKKTGEELIVKGLKGFEQIDFTVDAKTPNSNQKARDLADQGYKQK
jgi:hypothetical protein